MGCINKSSREFKFLAEKFKVSSDTLAKIIYKYYQQTSSEDVFPSDVYIQTQLGQTQYEDTNPSAEIVWNKWYKEPQRFNNFFDFKKAKDRALTFFPAHAVIEYTDNENKQVLVIKQPVEKIEPKHRKDFPSWQAYNDYLLVMGDLIPTDQREKEEQVIGSQPFTFKDGTTVTVPFRPNSQQEEALNVMNDFIKGNEATMTLSGYTGTGKTSLMEIIANKAKKEGKKIVFSASTNKAAAVLRDRVKSAGFTAQTLNKVFGIQVTPDEGKPYDANNLVVLLKEAEITPGTVVVIDEASMINEENYRILNGIAEDNNLKIIYVGDKGQLAPVKESQISKVFRNNNGRVVNLTKVERTDDNAILKEATAVRNGQPLSMESSFNEQGKGVAYIKKSNKDAIKEVVNKFVPHLKENPDYFRILAYTNAAVARYNTAVRNILGYTDNTPRVGEPIVGYNNWGSQYDRRTKQTTYRFVNSESYKVTKVGQPRVIYKTLDDGTSVQLQALPITLEDAMGNKDTFDFIDIKGNQQNREAATVLAREKARLFDQAKRLTGKPKADMVGRAVALEQFLFINDNIKEGGRSLQNKVFDFGYAMTVHKSQGSTFTHVLMDDADIATDMSVSESGNLFDMLNQPSTPATVEAASAVSNPNAVNMRQQLEYVAVSRATDTVTIISNNVKKEGSPLITQQAKPAQIQPQTAKIELPKGFKASTSREGAIHLEIGGRYGYPEYVNAMQRHLLVGDIYVSYNSQTDKYTIERGDRNGNYKTKELNSLTDEWIAAEAFKPQVAKMLEDYFKGQSQGSTQQQSVTISAQELLNSPEQRVKESKLLNKQNVLDVSNEIQGTLNIAIKVKDSDKLEGVISWVEKQNKWQIVVQPKRGVKYDDLSQKENDLTQVFFSLEETQNIVDKFLPKDLQEYYTSGKYKEGDKETIKFLETLEKEGIKTIAERAKVFNTSERAKGIGYNVLRDNWGIYTFNNYNNEINVLDANQVQGENITSKGSEFAKKLTNPGNNLEVVYKGRTFRNAEHAYQTWKSGEFDEVAYNSDAFKPRSSKPVNKQTNYQTMVEIITAKLQQHPDLVQGITERGGEAYLQASTHDVIGDKYWETKTGQNKFIEALTDAYKAIISGNVRSNNEEQIVTVAPYFRQSLDSSNKQSLEKATKETMEKANKLAKVIGLEVAEVRTIGGTYLGSSELTYQYVIKSTDQQKVDLFAAIMGDLSAEYQDAVIAANYVTKEQWDSQTENKAVELMYSVPQGTAIEDIEKVLQDVGIEGSSFNFENNTLSITAFSETEAIEISNKLKNTNYEQREINLQNSRYLDNERRRALYRTWISQNRGTQNRQLNNACSKALAICEAAARFPEETQESERLKAAQDAAEQWDATYLGKQPSKEITPGFYEGMITPDENTIFVFGSNPEGRHGAGAAKTAREKFGAKYGQGEGLQGNAYALPTKDLRITENRGLRSISPEQITENIRKMYEVAKQNPTKQFKVAYTNGLNETTLNGYTGAEMMKMFKDAGPIPPNVVFSKNWTDHWNEVKSETEVKSEQDNLLPLNEGTPVEQPQKVSLPSYEYFNDLYEDTEVDAAWKIPLLQDLDSQLTTDNPDNEAILSQMDRILQSPTEEDFLKSPTPERKEVNEKMTDYERRNNQMNALMDNEVGLAASEVKEIAEDIVNSISDIITEIQTDPNVVQQYFPTINPKVDLSKVSRKEIVRTVGINNFITKARERFENLRYDESNQDTFDLYDNPQLLDQADLILDNWETVIELAADMFVINEGFSIKRNTAKQSFETAEREFTGYDYDNYVDPQDEDSMREEKDEQEHWQVVARTIDVFNSMSDLVRLAIHQCYELDKNGNKILGKFGTPKRVNKVTAVNNILRWTQGTLDINEMIEKLDQKASRKPWVSQLTRRLRDTSGKEVDLQSQFYGVMHRHFQLYSIGQLDNGVYTSKTLNNHVALSEVMRGINAHFQLKSHPLFNSNGTVKSDNLRSMKGWHDNVEKIVKKYNIKFENGRYTSKEPLSDGDIAEAAKNLTAISRMLGYPVSEETMQGIVSEENLHKMYHKLHFMVRALDKEAAKPTKDYNPFEFEGTNSILSETEGFLAPIVEELEEDSSNAFFDNGNMYQSYVIPSFLAQLFDQFKQEDKNFKQWVEQFYGQSEWFKNRDGSWKLNWLDILSRDPKAREVFSHKVQLNFNKHDYMRNMTPEEFTLSVFMEYFAERLDMKNLNQTPAWFRVPIQSNKPSSEFIRFYADRGPQYKENIVNKMYDMFLQELSRIDTVRKRNRSGNESDAISSFDEMGRRFNFLPHLNQFLKDNGKLVNPNGAPMFFNADGTPDTAKATELTNLLNKKIDANVRLNAEEEARLRTLVQEVTMNFMQARGNTILDNWENSGILKAAEKVKGIKSLNHSVRENLENFLWNDFFAANQILQLTIVDKAFYPNAIELQKRLAELHAPGIRGNKFATDYNGKRVSDGFYRTILIKDFDGFTTNIIDNISEVFDRKIAAAPEEEKAGLKALKEALVGEKGAYRRINVTDGQAYSSPSSYRKKAFIFGKWSPKAEEIYQRLVKGDFSLTDLEVAFQPLKPFVYGHLSKEIGAEGVTPITKMPVPFQAKNSEYLLIMADALLRGQETGRPNLLKAIFNIMEESHYDEGHYGEENHRRTDGIDTAQFESAIKSGAQGVIDLTSFVETPGGEAGAYTLMKKSVFQENNAEDGSKYNYGSFVHKTDYDNYALQQEVPAHFREHQQAEGSQQRMNIPTDLDFYDYSGEVNIYSWKDPDGAEHKLNAKEFRREYERVHAANIEDSFNKLAEELHLLSEDKKARNMALSEILQDEILSSPRYGIDLFQACQIDPATGEFRMPKGDPIQAKRIEQLINSIIKNRVNKQKIAGGPIVQVSNFGTSRQLHIRFNDKQGNLLMTREEYEQNPQKKEMSQTDKFNARYGGKTSSGNMTYEEYVRENQAGIAHFEIFAPIGMKKLFDKFKNPDGSINLEAVEKCDPELLKVITGRIPNEDKYSIAHGKIVGFMPALAGDAIMFPYELTEIDDSDFDVDKRYTMQKVIDIIEDMQKIEKRLFQRAVDSYKKSHNGEISYEMKKKLSDTTSMLLDNPERMKTADSLSASLYQEYQRILREEYPYKTRYPKKGTRDANNNQIIDMSWAVMSNEMTADKILNPGGFEIPKHNAYVIAAYRNSNGSISWERLEGMTTKELQKLSSSEKDLAWFDTHVQFYKQNAAGSNLIGVFAVNKVAHAILEGDGLLINVEDFCGKEPFTICDTTFRGMIPVDPTKDARGQLIGKNIGSGVGASADTAKDPWLDMININMTTAGMFNALMRLGMPQEDAQLFMAQNVILRILSEFNRRSLEGEKTSLDKIIQDKLDVIRKKNHYQDDSEINHQPLTREELKEGLIPVSGTMTNEREAIEYKTLLAFTKVKTLAKAIRKPTTVTRLNSISSAVGPLIIDNIILEHKLQQFLQVEDDQTTGFYVKNPDGTFSPVDMDDILADHPILKQFSRPIDSRNPDCPTQIMFGDMPAGSQSFKAVLKALPSNIEERIYDDRQLLSKLSDFFQSYLLVASGTINPDQLIDYVNHFPEEFVGKGKDTQGNSLRSIKEQYPDNAFVQAIQLNYEKKSGKAFLNVNTTGMKEQEKERLRMAWTDLHKVNPELSTKLFTYAFFRRGIGFSPETWMGLVPTYVKEHLKGYVDTFRHFPKVNANVVIEQFIRNNWNNSTLAPLKGGEGTNYEVNLDTGTLLVRDEKDLEDLQGVKFMKTKHGEDTYLWKLLDGEKENKTSRFYVRIDPLGNNGEYMEMSTKANKKAISKITQLTDNTGTQELPDTSPGETENAEVETPISRPESDAQQSQNVSEVIRLITMQNKVSTQEATKLFENFKKRATESNVQSGFKKYLTNLFKQAGLDLDPDAAFDKFREFC